MNYQDTLKLLQEFNIFVDEMDAKVLNIKNNYNNKISQTDSEHTASLRKFNQSVDDEIAGINKKAQSMIKEARGIEAQINQMDKHLLEVDKYYEKTKKKKEEALKNEVSPKYKDTEDYFKALQEIKKQFNTISEKYSKDILPKILNGLNYMFSIKRKKDYEELIVLGNTVRNFIEQIKKETNELSNEYIEEMRGKFAQQRQGLLHSQNEFKNKLEQDYVVGTENLSTEIDSKLEEMFSLEVVDSLEDTIENYKKNYGRVNKNIKDPEDSMYIGFLEYPLDDFIQTPAVASIVKMRCKSIIENNNLRFPLNFSGNSTYTIMLTNITNRLAMQQFMQGIMFSFLSTVSVADLKLSVIDTENHGNSVDTFFEAKKKLPELFENKFYTNPEDAKEKLRSLNDRVEYISQELLGTEYKTIFEYNEKNPDSMQSLELLTIFDFPKGLDIRFYVLS